MGILDKLRAALGIGSATAPTPTRTTDAPRRRVTVTARVERSSGPPPGYESPYLSSDRHAELLVPRRNGLPPLHLTGHRGALWLAEDTTGKLVNTSNRYLRGLGIWAVSVRGTAHYAAKARIGPAELVREPDNPYDANAVAVHVGGKIIGHFNKQKAAALAKVLDAGEQLEATIISTDPAKVIAARPEILAHLRRRL